MINEELAAALQAVRDQAPLVHCITNYVTVNDCANALLALGASPIMSDEPEDVEDITTICNALTLNIGTLNERSIEGMKRAGAQAGQLGHQIVLDPVGAGASRLRTSTASDLLDSCAVGIVRANMSEMKAIAGTAQSTRGVDVNPDDAVNEGNRSEAAAFARALSRSCGAVCAVTGAIDIIADDERALAVRNGSPLLGRITGSGCMLSCITAAFAAAWPASPLVAAAAAVVSMGLAGEAAAARMGARDGNGSFRAYLIDALYNLDADTLAAGARVEELA